MRFALSCAVGVLGAALWGVVLGGLFSSLAAGFIAAGVSYYTLVPWFMARYFFQ